ncbi:hypothetical protein L6164_034708 [Bauhinia variegata]|uniref:Uncharacterized protein n=1 Tax=Bauhinia variegata TaxID=167791 RepID=A0ACB9KVG8_BAUVA|nr:hypothetical protein L6164_034708 [Bauhinia variegata]
MSSLGFLYIVFLTLPFVSGHEKLSAYQVLEQYDFPIGLLPVGVTDYELNRDTGEFSAYLTDASCSFSIESYQLKYKSPIKGVISKGKLSNLKGVSVKVLFFWLNIVEVTSDGGDLQFSVGIASADFGVENFLESPRCGCGFDCVQSQNVLVSSV